MKRLTIILLTGLTSRLDSNDPLEFVSEETFWQAQSIGFDYARTASQALRGNATAIEQMIAFTMYTDAGGALGHGVVLVEILKAVGDHVFANVVLRQPKDIRERLRHVLEAGGDYGPANDFTFVQREFPFAYQAASR